MPATLRAEDQKRLNETTNPTWPHVHVHLDCAYKAFVRVFPCNVILVVDGDRVQSLVSACEIARITPVLLGPAGATHFAPLLERLERA